MSNKIRKKNKLSLREKSELYSTISRIIRTGVNLPVVLEEHYKLAQTRAYKRIIRRIITGVKKGKTFEFIFNDREGGISQLDRNLIRAAERSGRNEQVFEELSNYYNEQYFIRKKLLSSISGPTTIFIIACFIAATPALFNVGIKKFLFDSLIYIVSVVLLVGASYLFFRRIKKKAETDPEAGKMWYAVPMWGEIAKKLDLYRFSKVFSICVSSGIGLSQSMNLAANATETFLLREEIYKARYLIEKKGYSLTQAFGATPTIGNLMHRLIATGELSGTLDGSLLKFSNYIFEDIKHQVTNFVKFVKITAYIFAALFVLSRIALLYAQLFNNLKF